MMVSSEDEYQYREAKKRVDEVISRLGLTVIEDKDLDRELDILISEFPSDTPFGKLMGEARRRFLYRADMEKVAHALREKKKLEGSFRQGSARWH